LYHAALFLLLLRMEFEGRCIIFSAPSGAGKTTIVRYLLEKVKNLEFSISATSRPKREYEVDGYDYYFLSVSNFKDKIKEDEFIEWEEVYTDNFYGTLKTEIERIWKEKKHVIFDVDVMGGIQLKSIFKEKALSIFVQPPSIQELENRLIGRGSETPETIIKRVGKAEVEMKSAQEFDYILINDTLEAAKKEARKVVCDFLEIATSNKY